MPTTIAIPDSSAWESQQPGELSSWCTPLVVVNTNSMQASDTPTDPYKILLETDTKHANVYVIPLPSGTSYVTLHHEWVGTTPTTDPVVGCFLRPASSSKLLYQPNDVHASYYAPSSAHGLWVPGCNVNTGAYQQALSGLVQELNAASKRSQGVTFHARGMSHAMFPIVTAAVGPTRGLIVATCEG